ncbi:MAG: hypothetical protein AAB842_00390 [Patescibacteria group bacterium]
MAEKTVFEKTQSWPHGTFVNFFCTDKQRWVEGTIERVCVGYDVKVKEKGLIKETPVDVRSISEVKSPAS